MRIRSLTLLFVLAAVLLLPAVGCQRWGTRMEGLRDERIGQINQNLGVGEEGRRTSREQAMPTLENAQ